MRALGSRCSSRLVAAAVHAGLGASHNVVFCVGKGVAHFFELLALSPKWKPYSKDAPAVPTFPKEPTIIAQELAAAVKGKDKMWLASDSVTPNWPATLSPPI